MQHEQYLHRPIGSIFVKADPVAQILSEIVNIDTSKLEQQVTVAKWKSYIVSVLLDFLDGKS